MNTVNWKTPEQAAAILNLAPITIYRAVKSGKLKAYKVGRMIRIDENDLNRWVKGE